MLKDELEFLTTRIMTLVAKEKAMMEELPELEQNFYRGLRNIISRVATNPYIAKELENDFTKITDFVAALHSLYYLKTDTDASILRQKAIYQATQIERELREKEAKC